MINLVLEQTFMENYEAAWLYYAWPDLEEMRIEDDNEGSWTELSDDATELLATW